MNCAKKNIRALRDEELPNFNPGEFLLVTDVHAETLEKYGHDMFPDHFRKKKDES